MKAKITLANIGHYLTGNFRSILRSIYPDTLPKHIEEQFEYRCIKAKECLDLGKCKVCGCETPQLFLSNKPCDNNPPCYPHMMTEEVWEQFKEFNKIETKA